MAYIRTGSETQMGLGHPESACKCHSAQSGLGSIFEFSMSSIVPWALLLGVGYLILKSPESHGHLAGTARQGLSRVRHSAQGALQKYKRRRIKRKLGRYRR